MTDAARPGADAHHRRLRSLKEEIDISPHATATLERSRHKRVIKRYPWTDNHLGAVVSDSHVNVTEGGLVPVNMGDGVAVFLEFRAAINRVKRHPVLTPPARYRLPGHTETENNASL